MSKLIKYEFVKKSKLFLILIITAILANIGLGLAYGQNGIAIFLGISPLVLGIIYLYELIKTYSDDLNKKSGYMLFMTPNSGYAIIGSKLITIILVGFIFFTSYAIFVLANLSIIAYKMVGDFSLIADGLNQIVEALNMLLSGTLGINIGDLILVFIVGIVSAIVFILTVYSAITIRKSIFSNTKFGGVLSFIIFVIINVIYGNLADLVGKIFNFEFIVPEINTNVAATYPSAHMFQIFAVMIVFNCIMASILMLGSGYLVEKKINL